MDSNKIIHLNCPKCLDRIITPFLKCVNNHLVCGRCQCHYPESNENNEADTKDCINTEKPCDDLDKSFKNGMTFCQFECGKRALLKDIVEHEGECSKRNWPAACLIENCNWTGFSSGLISHMEEHPDNIVVNCKQPERMVKVNYKDPVTLVILYNRSYHFNDLYWIRLIKEEDKRYIAIQRQGGVGNIDDQKMEEFTIFSASIAEGIEGKVIDAGYREDSDMDELIKFHKIDVSNSLDDTLNIFLKENGTEILPDFLTSKLECPVCMGLLCGEIFICQNGHSVCGRCRTQTGTECPLCKADVTEIRNYALESLTNNCVSDCKYSSEGCAESIQTGKLNDHIEHCIFRNTNCLYICDWEGPIAKFYEHYSEAHEWFKGNGVPHKIKAALDTEYYYADGLTAFGKTFFMKYSFTSDFAFRVEELTEHDSTSYYFEAKFTHPVTGHTVGFTAPCWTTKSVRDTHPSYADNRQIERQAFVKNICDEKEEFLSVLSIYKNN